MNLQKYAIATGIPEEEILKDLHGYYKTAFFHIYLEGNFNTDTNKLTQAEQGTFFHEYIHYWQNIATSWGLYSSILRYKEVILLKQQIISSKEISLPFKISYPSNLYKQIQWRTIGNGETNDEKFKSRKIDVSEKIEIKKDKIISLGKEFSIIKLNIPFVNTGKEVIELGAHIIKEGMAALYQSLIDPDANNEHNDIPYNLIKILCNNNFPSIANDTPKLICICYASLFSLTPGVELISLLESAVLQPELTGTDIFTNFVNDKKITRERVDNNKTIKEEISIIDILDLQIRQFKELLSVNLVAELDYINEALERCRLTNPTVPFLTVLYDNDCLSNDNQNELISYMGIPYIQTAKNGFHFPQSPQKETDEEVSSLDVLETIAQSAIFTFLTKPSIYKGCPLYYMCVESDYTKDGCFGAPWADPECSFTIASEYLGLKEKDITWTF